MNRSITNIIRFLMDDCLPAIIRDNKYFMYPFYYIAYRGRDIHKSMHFKSLVYSFTEEEYSEFYNYLNTISRNRKTDLNKPSIDFIINNLDKTAKNLIDIGCGKGYFLKQLRQSGLELYGCDIVDKDESREYNYIKGNIEKLPFDDKQFDIVTCFHTLEHINNLDVAISELKRITRKQLIIAVPCQRYFYYTLDEHVNFFPFKEKLTSVINIEKHTCDKIWGDWVYIGYPMN